LDDVVLVVVVTNIGLIQHAVVVIHNLTTQYGLRHLYIWVSKDQKRL